MKSLSNIVLMALLIINISSCNKKDLLPQPTTFAGVIFNDPLDVGVSSIRYQGTAIAKPVLGLPLTVLPGEGKFEFFNAKGIKVLEKTLNTDKDIVKTYIFFKPDPNAEQVELLENTQDNEPAAAEDHIKVKIANFAQAVLGNRDIKIVFNQDGIPCDTIQTRGSDYTSGYSEMTRAFKIVRGVKRVTTLYQVTYLNESNQPILDLNGSPVSTEYFSLLNQTIYTLFLSPNPNNPNDPTTPPVLNTLFSN